ncbi:MAG TPA: PEP-CTERM sorting domain-containing protein [Gemmataceae bacterium]|jgi:hypothetical protein|nr:PEP-CTERM sorting domain-containing protein [Gemmataceae bacterium]
MRGGKSWKKWVSLSTLSVAGAAGGAHSLADVIVVPVNQNFNYNSNTPYTLDLPGINKMQVFSTQVFVQSMQNSKSVALGGVAGATYFHVRRYTAQTFLYHAPRKILQGAPAGKKWASAGGTVGNMGLLGAADSVFGPIGPSSYTDRYFAFQFKDAGGQVDYGWLQATLNNVSSPQDIPVTITQYAYDTSGNPLPMGSITSAVPEPTSTALAGLGALVLGAVGVRRWRKAKQTAGV